MAKVVVKTKAKKVKKKYPVDIVAPDYLNSVKLSSSKVSDLNSLVGMSTKINMMYVTGNVKNQNVRLTFKITQVNSGLAKTEVKTYEQIPYYLGRFVKKGSDLIDDSFVCKSKDNYVIRVKPFIVTKMNTSILTKSLLQAKTREYISKQAQSSSYGEFMGAVIQGRIQIALRNELKKIFPLKALEFRKVGFDYKEIEEGEIQK